MTKMQTGKKDLKQYLGHAGMGIIKEMQDISQKRVMGALVKLLGDDLDMLVPSALKDKLNAVLREI